MAKDEDVKKEAVAKTDDAGGSLGLFTWLILGAVVVAGATGGFALSQLMGGQESPVSNAETGVQGNDTQTFDALLASQAANGGRPWVFDGLEPVLANLDEPGVTRYVRVTISLEISPEMDQVKGDEFLKQRTMLLRDWLTTYFAGLSLEDVRGSRNLNRIKREINDQFNALLFPKSKPFVQQILFREFAVQ